MRLDFAATTDVGRYRKDNQDSGYAGPHLLVICDGVGGAARGDIASSTGLHDGSEVKIGRTTMTVRVEEDDDV